MGLDNVKFYFRLIGMHTGSGLLNKVLLQNYKKCNGEKKHILLVSLALFIFMSTYGVHNVANLRKQKDCLAYEQ